MARGIGPNSPQYTVPLETGQSFWEVVSSHAAVGHSRAECAKALGYRSDYFCKLLANNPDKDPFDPYGVVANYVRDTGEYFKPALIRMAKEGLCMTQAARLIGFTSKHALAYAMRVRGIKVEFPDYVRPKKHRARVRPEGLTAPRNKTTGEHPWRAAEQSRVNEILQLSVHSVHVL